MQTNKETTQHGNIMRQIFYILYQYLIALPIFIVLTIFTALTTIAAIPWKNAEWLHKIQQFWARSFCRLLFLPITVEGLENIEPHKSYVFVSNHQSLVDVFVIYGWLPVIFKWIMKKELRKVPLVGAACKAAGHIYIDRSNKVASMRSIEEAERIVKNGVCIVIFPEGTRTRTGEVGRFKRGAFSIATDLHLPIIPISLSGCYEVMPRTRFYARHHATKMTVGKPIDTDSYTEEDRNILIEYTRQEVLKGMETN